MNLRQLALIGIAAIAVGGTAVAQAAQPQVVAQIGPTSAPSATPSPAGRHRRVTPTPSATPTETPEPPQFQTMDGVWELQMQPLNGSIRTTYSHLYITQSADQLTGTWVKNNGQKLTFTGSFDGRLFKINLKDAAGKTYTMSGYVENFSDMVGLFLTSDPNDKGIPFTAAHRKRERLS